MAVFHLKVGVDQPHCWPFLFCLSYRFWPDLQKIAKKTIFMSVTISHVSADSQLLYKGLAFGEVVQ